MRSPGRAARRMIRYIALLRGINVGRAKRVAMADLRAVVDGLGYGDVQTLLNSGNIVFTSAGSSRDNPGRLIEKAISERLGVSSRVTTISAGRLSEIIAENPLVEPGHDPSRLLVALPAEPDGLARLEPLARRDWSPEALALGPDAAYLWCPNGVLASRTFEAVNRELGDAVTTRNWATMLKLQALAAQGR